MTLLARSLFYYSQLGANETFWALLPGAAARRLGMALTMTPVTAAAMSAVAVDKAGVGSAVLNSARQVGGSLGIAVMGAIVAVELRLPDRVPRRAARRRAPLPSRVRPSPSSRSARSSTAREPAAEAFAEAA